MIMTRNFRLQPRFIYTYCRENIRATALLNFKTEESSNNHVSSLCKQKHYKEALEAFNILKKSTSFQIQLSTYVDLICACSSLKSLEQGFSQLGYELQALTHLKDMLCQSTFQPNEFLFGSAFSACSSLLQPEYGRQLHVMCIKVGLGADVFAGCALCDMYARCGYLDSSRAVFNQIERPDIVSWNAIIAGFADSGEADEAIFFFSRLRQTGLIPDDITVRSLLCACDSPLALSQGMQVHSYVTKTGFLSNVPVSNTLLTMYAKCSDFCNAFRVFEEMRHNIDSVSWNAILTACMQHNHFTEVFRLFKLMLGCQSKPDHITLGNLLGACAELSSLEIGYQVHCYTQKNGLVLDVFVMNKLIDMYAKCGFLKCAKELFNSMKIRDVVSWSSLIVGYAQSGYGEEALKLFTAMRSFSVIPNQVTFVGVLTACSHVGLVEEGWYFYKAMQIEYGIQPKIEHCSCMVDLLGRAGRLNEAEDFIKQMSLDPDIVVWKTLLAACKTHGNVDIAKRSAENILKLDPSNSSAYVLLCNIYASSGSWGDVARLRSSMKQKAVKKVPGQSWIELKDRIHIFFAEDTLHPDRDKIYNILGELWLQMLDVGYAPATSNVLNLTTTL